jgi:hypothetical protein
VVVGGDAEGNLWLHEGKKAVKHKGIKEQNDRWRRSLIEADGGEGSSKSVAPGNELQRLRGQAASLGRGESGAGLQVVEWRAK